MNDSMAQVYRNSSGTRDVGAAAVVRHAVSTSETPPRVTPSSTGDASTTKEHSNSGVKLTWKAIGEAVPASKPGEDAAMECTPEATPTSEKSAQKRAKKRHSQSQSTLEDEVKPDSDVKKKVKRRKLRVTESGGGTSAELQGSKTKGKWELDYSGLHLRRGKGARVPPALLIC